MILYPIYITPLDNIIFMNKYLVRLQKEE